ncbi:unnamed protein product [Brassica napus]|uniref:(rape) hypothetical protein n=1 Tax=Brassica napus TaxID=3708 RepID=A0A816I791_BRANA|nr:unnamed protein product [Brassica napus]
MPSSSSDREAPNIIPSQDHVALPELPEHPMLIYSCSTDPFGCKEYLPKALSKLALALEKNLLVTSMLSISTEPQSQPTEEANAATEDTKTAAENGTQPNGIEAVVGAEGNYFKGLSVVGCCC